MRRGVARSGDGNVPAYVCFDVFDSDFEWKVGGWRRGSLERTMETIFERESRGRRARFSAGAVEKR